MIERMLSETELFNPSTVTFAVCTRYIGWQHDCEDIANTNQVRGNLAKKFITDAVEAGYSVVVMDSGSSDEWINNLPEKAIVETFGENNFGKQKAAAILRAAQVPGTIAIGRVEAEKAVNIIESIPILAKDLVNNKADIVVGSRMEPEFSQSYPDYAYKAEIRTKDLLNKVVGIAGFGNSDVEIDYYSGFDFFRNDSRVMELVKKRYHYTGPTGDYSRSRAGLDGWFHAQVGPMIEAQARGMRVVNVPIHYQYPDDQRKNEEHPDNIQAFRTKRNMQTRVAVGPAIQLVRHIICESGDTNSEGKPSLFSEES